MTLVVLVYVKYGHICLCLDPSTASTLKPLMCRDNLRSSHQSIILEIN
jgi:hypothetical protein